MWLRQSTASQEILLGPFLDSTDGNTQETALTINNTDIKLWKEGATTEANKNSGGATHIANGRYYAVLDATDTNTLGKLEVNVHVTGALAVRREYMVLPANVYDSLVLGTDTLQADAIEISGDAAAANNLEADYDGTGYDKSASTIGTVTAVATGGITAASIAADAIGASELAADAVAEIADGVWDEAKSGHVAAGSFGEEVQAHALSSEIAALNDISVADILTTQMTEAYAADGVAPTLAQALFAIMQQAGEFSISGTTITVKKLDGSTAAMTFTLDDGTNPTSRTRAT